MAQQTKAPMPHLTGPMRERREPPHKHHGTCTNVHKGWPCHLGIRSESAQPSPGTLPPAGDTQLDDVQGATDLEHSVLMGRFSSNPQGLETTRKWGKRIVGASGMQDTKETRPSTHSMIDIHMNSPRLGQRAHGLQASEPEGVLELKQTHHP